MKLPPHMPSGSIVFEGVGRLLKKVEDALNFYGPEAFFTSSSEQAKEAREAMAGLFYVLALNKESGRYWWIKQADKVNIFPDFEMFMLADNPFMLAKQGVELVTIGEWCKTYEKMYEVIEKKISGKNYLAGNYSLLIFLNNINSKLWLPRLHKDLASLGPFKSISTIHLLSDRTNKTIERWIVNKIRPLPVQSIEVNLSELHDQPRLPESLIEEIEYNGQRLITIKPEAIALFRLNRKARREKK